MGTDRTPDRGAIAGTSQPRTEAQRRADARALADAAIAAHHARLRDLSARLFDESRAKYPGLYGGVVNVRDFAVQDDVTPPRAG